MRRAPQSDADQATTLVIMESGANWPFWVKEIQQRAPNSMVEVQPGSESAHEFADRVMRRLSTLRDRGTALVGVVYAASSPVSDETHEVRRELCGVLLRELAPDGELVLSGDGWRTWGVDAHSRERLLGLAGDLSYELEDASQTVSVRFSDPLEESPFEESGVHKAPGLASAIQARLAMRKAQESA